jgi:magnesium chelatase family protein
VERVQADDLLSDQKAESTAVMAHRVQQARQRAVERAGVINADLPGSLLEKHAPLTKEASALLRHRLDQGNLTGRGLHRIRRVALTLADLRGEDGPLNEEQIGAALSLRSDPLARREVAA